MKEVIPFREINIKADKSEITWCREMPILSANDKKFLKRKYRECENAINKILHLQSVVYLTMLKHNLEGQKKGESE
jgi:hypothetical protein